MEKNIAVIWGDCSSPEIVKQTIRVLDKVAEKYGHTFHYTDAAMGGEAIDKYGDPLPQHELDKCLAADSVLLGAVGGPKWEGLPGEQRPEKGLLRLRAGMGLYSNNRPAKIWPQLAPASPLKPEIVAKGIDFINSALARPQLQGNTVLYEMLGAAYYNRGTLERNNDREDLTHAAECFQQVISLGVQREYLYTNAFTAWQAIGEYSKAKDVLEQMEAAYPQLYTPHALRAMLWIMEENGKDQLQRNYRPAYEQYELALEKVTSQDETTQLQQLEGLIQQLKSGGWL